MLGWSVCKGHASSDFSDLGYLSEDAGVDASWSGSQGSCSQMGSEYVEEPEGGSM